VIKRWLVIVGPLLALLLAIAVIAQLYALNVNALIISTLIGLISVAFGALIGPLAKDWLTSYWEKEELRRGLYRELARWYELAVFYVRDYDRKSENRFFTPSVFDVRPEGFKTKKEPTVGESVLQAERSSEVGQQIGRIGRESLQWKIDKLQETFERLNSELTEDNLYSKTLRNESRLQLFYQLRDCASISECYENFRYALQYRLTRYDSVPNSRFLTAAEATRLSELEARLDWLKITYLAFAQAEDSGEFDAKLLNQMRTGKRRGTVIHYTGEASETARWCLHCEQYSEPENISLLKERCKHCKNVLPTVAELTKLLFSRDDERRMEAIKALAKTYKYSASELKSANVQALISALHDPLPSVRECAASALQHLGKRLEKVRAAKDVMDLRDQAVAALIATLSRSEQELRVKRAAIYAIGKIYYGSYDAGKARKALARALGDAHEMVEAAAWTIGVIGDGRLFYLLQALPKTPGFYAREYAPAVLEALGRFGHFGKDTIKLCIRVLTDEGKTVEVRRTAAFILGNIGDVSEVWEPLTEIAQDQNADADLQSQAKQALASLAPQHTAAPVC